MLTVDDMISFGYFRKYYHTMVDDILRRDETGKDYANKAANLRERQGEARKDVLKEISIHNKTIKEEAEAFARGVVQISVDSLNRRGISLEEAKEMFKSG